MIDDWVQESAEIGRLPRFARNDMSADRLPLYAFAAFAVEMGRLPRWRSQ
jgi:hypothetical protein